MATFMCRADSGEIWSAIEESCLKHDARLCRLDAHSGNFRLPIKAKWWNDNNRHQVIFRINTTPDPRNSAYTRLEIVGEFSRASLLRYAIGFSLGVTALVLFIAVALSFLRSIAIVLVLGMPALVVSVSSLFLSIRHMHIASRLNTVTIRTTLDDLDSKFHIQAIHPHPFFGFRDKKKDLILIYALVLFFIGAVYIYIGPMVALIACLLLSPEVFHNLFMSHRNDWRSSLSFIQLQWTLSSASVIIIALLLLLSSGAMYVGVQDVHFLSGSNPVIAMQEAVYQFITETNSDDREARMIAQEIETGLSEYIRQADNKYGNRTYLLGVFHFVSSTLFLLVGMVLAVVSVTSIFSASEKWNLAVKRSSGKSTLRPPAPVEAMYSLKTKMGIISGFVLSGVLHWIAAIISIDIVSYYCAGHVIFFRPMGAIISMFELSSEGSRSFFIRTFESPLFFGIMALPGLLNIMMVIKRIPGLMYQGPSRMRGCSLGNKLQELNVLLDAICKTTDLVRPRIVIKKNQTFGIYSDVGFLHRGGKIVINSGLLEFLNERELQALLAHELYHLRYDTRNIFAYKLFSMFLLCPFDVILLLHDFAESEYEADDFATKLMGDAKPLREALIKLGTYNITASPKGAGHMRMTLNVFSHLPGVAERIWSVLILFFDRSLFGATYPSLSERLQRLSAFDTRSPGC